VDSVNQKKKVPAGNGILDRFAKSSFPPAAVLGAFVSFFTTAFRQRPNLGAERPKGASLVQIGFPKQPNKATSIQFDLKYSRTLVLGAASSAHPFRQSLSGIAVDSADRIFVLGDGEVQIFEPGGNMIRRWRAPEGTLCLTVDAGERVFLGLVGRLEICDANGVRIGGFAVGESTRPALITAIRVWDQDILIADAAAKLLRRYNSSGRHLGTIGAQGKIRSFMLPNRSLDFDIDAEGYVRATDPGRHRVSSWRSDGSAVGHFGKFGLSDPGDFVGCCNPVNLAVARDGRIITAEKVAARIKIYKPDGKLIGLIGSENFDPRGTHFPLAVDSKGRILVADPIRLEVQIFSPSAGSGGGKNI
jgi:hypothetical protein